MSGAVPDGLITGFERRRLPGHDGVTLDALVGGSGPPLLLLHGYPQTRVAWKAVAPVLAERFTLVIPDLRGYGRSDKPQGDPHHETYSKRTMACDAIATMAALGFHRFAVAGHDRGARVAYRLALDHPEVVTRIAPLDILTTADQWATFDANRAVSSYHWAMLAQPHPLPETLIGADPGFFIRWTLRSWAGEGFAFDPESLEDYVACFSNPASIQATCEDYRAGWTLDRARDEADRGRRIEMPVLTLWGEDYGVAKTGPLDHWRSWASDIRGHGVPGGHFNAEEAPAEVAAALLTFFGEN